MYREKMQELEAWKGNRRRKPMLLLGARQVGKTWLMQEFGRKNYKEVAYIRFDQDTDMRNSFMRDSQVDRLLNDIRLFTGCQLAPGESLIILDEIQECPPVIAALKFFCEEAREQHIVAAGSLLGLSTAGGTGFPVGKVNQIDMHPMSFMEFLLAMGMDAYAEAIHRHRWDVLNRMSTQLEDMLRLYYYVGGMPEAVSLFAETKDYVAVRIYQTEVLRDYRNDFGKHATADESRRIARVWDYIPLQLAQENRQFLPHNMQNGGMALRQTRQPLQWLKDAGLIHTVPRVRTGQVPLGGYVDNAFKVYGTDVGLLSAQCRLDRRVLLKKNEVFGQYKGALTEQYVMQQLLASGVPELYYWKAAQAQAEVDFLVTAGAQVFPVEVKAERNLRAKSLKSYYKRHENHFAVRCSMAPFSSEKVQEGHGGGYTLLDVPLWAVGELPNVLEELCE